MSAELLEASKQRIASLIAPVNGGVGEDISYDEVFDAIKNETDNLASVTGERCDWGTVLMNSEQLLEEKSKDFRCGIYWATCKLRTDNMEGVLDAFILLESLVEQYWDEMFPPLRRIKARAGMVSWMSDLTGPILAERKLKVSDGPLVAVIDQASKRLDATLSEKMGDKHPGIVELQRAIRDWVKNCPKEAAKEAPAPAAAGGAAPAAAAAPAARPAPEGGVSVSAGSRAEAIKELASVGKAIVKLGFVIRTEKPDDPIAYQLTRVGTWLRIQTLPPATDGKTMVKPPQKTLRSRFDILATANDWVTLIGEAETAACNAPFWLDPVRYAATAMAALGPMFMKAHAEYVLQVAVFLKKFPAMAGLSFADGTPYADGQTQMWLESEVVPLLEGGDGGGASADDGALAVAKDEARSLVMKGDLGAALDVLGVATSAAPSPSERFRGRLAIAQLCLQAGKHDIAQGQLEGLVSTMEEHQLVAWDPALCAEVYASLCNAYRGVLDAFKSAGKGAPQPPQHLVEAERSAFAQLCKLDPATALKVAG